MRILYVAKHDQPDSNDDEGAIAHALTALGHDVQRLQEHKGSLAKRVLGVDLLLFHKWHDPEMLQRFDGICPRVFWYFDLVDWPADPTLAARCEARKRWMWSITSHVELGFCTDGDWVAADATGKLRWLPQGADERLAGFGIGSNNIDILFTGIGKGGGQQRESFVEEMRRRWGSRFWHVPTGVHGRALADTVASAKVAVCPDSPVTDRYWSNRVFLLAGFGATLLHPHSAGLVKAFPSGVMRYSSREELHVNVDHLLSSPDDRRALSQAAFGCVVQKHLYRHRCEELLLAVQGLKR